MLCSDATARASTWRRCRTEAADDLAQQQHWVEAESLESQLAGFFGVKAGVLVRSVSPDPAAAKAGLRVADVIVKAGDTPVASLREISSAIRASRSASNVVLQIVRNKREMSLSLVSESSRYQAYRIISVFRSFVRAPASSDPDTL